VFGSVWALVVLSGCATKSFVRTETAQVNTYTDTRVSEVKSDVDQVRTKADQAFEKATLAEKLASANYEYVEVSTHQVQFEFDDYRLSTEAQSLLDHLAAELSAHPRYVLEVRGFADATGSDRYNYRLGRERAEEVMRSLMTKYGVPSSRVAIVSFGEENPVADNSSSDGRTQNRRVVIRLLEAKIPGEPVATTP
jgi:outer membrane protein OmpA-like peptidoglycan-associated protein